MEIAINATKRTINGKKVKSLRQSGKLPAVLYGHDVETQQIEVNEKDFGKVFKQAGESTIVNLVVDGKTQPVLIHEVQNHYLTSKPIHIDFYAVDMTQKIKVNVPLHFVGESAAVKTLGGTQVTNLSEIEVECLPADLPHAIEVDISSLETFENMIRVSDLQIPDKVTIVANPEEVVVKVAPPRTEEELKSLEEAVTEDVTKVEGVVKPEPGAAAEGVEAEATDEVKAEKKEKE
jgi:large subunit ribosomal protein L25